MTDTLEVEGVTEFLHAVEKLRADLPHAVQVALGDVATTVVGKAQPRIPILTGAARRSVHVEKTGSAASIVGGGSSVPYFAIIGGARIIANAFVGFRDEPARILEAVITETARTAGLEMS